MKKTLLISMKKNTTTILYMKCPFNKTLPLPKTRVCEIKEKISIREYIFLGQAYIA